MRHEIRVIVYLPHLPELSPVGQVRLDSMDEYELEDNTWLSAGAMPEAGVCARRYLCPNPQRIFYQEILPEGYKLSAVRVLDRAYKDGLLLEICFIVE